MGSFSAVDIICVVVLLGFAAFSFFRGFVHQALSIGAWVGAVVVTMQGFPLLRPFVRERMDSTLGADLASGIGLFLVSLLVLSILTKAISDRVRNSALNSLDSALGVLFGLIVGAGLLSGAYLGIAWMSGADQTPPDWLASAKARPWLERGAILLKTIVPEQINAADTKAREIKNDAKDLMEAEKTFRKFVSPLPAAQPEGKAADQKAGDKDSQAKPAKGYDKESRSQLDRLIQTNQ